MAITFLQLSERLNHLANDLSGDERGVIMTKLAEDALALVKTRVQETGVNADGDKFKDYSTKPMLAGRKSFKTEEAFNKIAGSKKKRSELEWVTIGGSGFSSYLDASAGGQGPSNSGGKHLFVIPGGYKEFRELHTRQTAFVDFTFSGRMWGNIKLVSSKTELDSGVAVIKATQELEKKKLSGLTEKRGGILELSKKEEMELTQDYEIWVRSMLRKNQLL